MLGMARYNLVRTVLTPGRYTGTDWQDEPWILIQVLLLRTF